MKSVPTYIWANGKAPPSCQLNKEGANHGKWTLSPPQREHLNPIEEIYEEPSYLRIECHSKTFGFHQMAKSKPKIGAVPWQETAVRRT